MLISHCNVGYYIIRFTSIFKIYTSVFSRSFLMLCSSLSVFDDSGDFRVIKSKRLA